MKIYCSHEIEEGYAYPDKAFIEHVRFIRMEGKDKTQLGWALRIWIPSYKWGKIDYGNTDAWLQGYIQIISVDWERGLPQPWNWSLEYWVH